MGGSERHADHLSNTGVVALHPSNLGRRPPRADDPRIAIVQAGGHRRLKEPSTPDRLSARPISGRSRIADGSQHLRSWVASCEVVDAQVIADQLQRKGVAPDRDLVHLTGETFGP